MFQLPTTATTTGVASPTGTSTSPSTNTVTTGAMAVALSGSKDQQQHLQIVDEKNGVDLIKQDGSDQRGAPPTMWLYPSFPMLPNGAQIVGAPITVIQQQQLQQQLQQQQQQQQSSSSPTSSTTTTGKTKTKKRSSKDVSTTPGSSAKKAKKTPNTKSATTSAATTRESLLSSSPSMGSSSASSGAGSRSGKGLRLFSMKVCEQVQKKGTTTYNEVANELVKEFMEQSPPSEKPHDEKNIRRRVYDALNVLMAVGIITKDKKDIKWQGLPIDYQQEVTNLMDIKKQRLENLQMKGRQLTELIKQQRSLAHLYSRNTSTQFLSDTSPRVSLPFIIVHTDNETNIECEMDTPMTEVFFNFSAPFEIHDDNEILSRLGFDEPEQQLLRAQSPQQQQEQDAVVVVVDGAATPTEGETPLLNKQQELSSTLTLSPPSPPLEATTKETTPTTAFTESSSANVKQEKNNSSEEQGITTDQT